MPSGAAKANGAVFAVENGCSRSVDVENDLKKIIFDF